MKKLLSTIMALVMLLSLVPMAVAEEGGTEGGAEQSNSVYKVTEAAQLVWAAKNCTEDTIRLKNNLTLSEPVKITKSVILDLGDYTITYEGEGDLRAIYVENGANVQIKANANGGVTAATIALQVNPGGKLTVDGGTYNAAYAVAVFSNETRAEAVLNSGTYNGFVYTNGTNKNSHVTFNGGTYNKQIYLAAGDQSAYEITDGLFNASLEIDAGQLDILGGTFKNSVDTSNNVNRPTTNNNGSGAYEGIIVVCKPDGSSTTGYIGDAVVNIKGGTFDNTFANGETLVVADFGKDEKGAGAAKVTISGDAVVKGRVALYASENDNDVSLAVSGGAFTDLASAVKYATDGATITLAGDTKGDIVIPAGKTITLDLGGHKLTNVSGDTITNKGTLTITGTGTVDNVTNGKAALVNYGTATLNGGNFTRSKENAENNKDNGGGNSYYTILNDKGATMTINEGVTVSNVGHFSSMIRNGGDEKTAAVSTMTINGGTFSGGINTVKNDENGVLTINGGDFSNTDQFVIMNWNKATISGGTFEANASAEAVLFTAKWSENRAVGELKIEGGMYVCAANQKLIVDRFDNNDQYLGTAVISAGAFNVAPDAKYLAEGMIVVPGLKDAPYNVQPAKRTNEEENTETEVKVDGDNVTVTVTDKTTGTTTETVTDTKTGAETKTVTETKKDGNVTTKTETVTEKAADGTTKTTESKIVENDENGKTETKTTVDGTTVKTDVTVNQAPATASDVTLDAKALEGKAAGTDTSSVTVDQGSLNELKNDTVKDVIIKTNQATLTLNKAAVKTMEGNVPTNGKMTLSVKVTEEKNATEIEKIKVEVEAKDENNKNVFPPETQNTNGKITITIPYTGNATYLDLWYTTNGNSTYMGRFPVVAGFVSFDVKHFSQYDLIPVASSGSSVIKTGAGSSAASTTQTVTTDLTPGSITKVTVDGKVVDAKYYTVSGSNVTFTAEFLKTLKNGSHTVTVENATKIAKGVFTVNNPTTAVQAPTTADAGIALYAGMAIASVMGTGVVFTSRKRKNH